MGKNCMHPCTCDHALWSLRSEDPRAMVQGLGGGEETGKALEAAVSSCDGSLTQLQADVGGLTSEADELRAFGNEALGENERLQKENEDLRKSCEDAVLDQYASASSPHPHRAILPVQERLRESVCMCARARSCVGGRVWVCGGCTPLLSLSLGHGRMVHRGAT